MWCTCPISTHDGAEHSDRSIIARNLNIRRLGRSTLGRKRVHSNQHRATQAYVDSQGGFGGVFLRPPRRSCVATTPLPFAADTAAAPSVGAAGAGAPSLPLVAGGLAGGLPGPPPAPSCSLVAMRGPWPPASDRLARNSYSPSVSMIVRIGLKTSENIEEGNGNTSALPAGSPACRCSNRCPCLDCVEGARFLS